MRYLTIPAPAQLIGGDGKAIPYAFRSFLREMIWRDARWGQDAAWEAAAESLGDKLDTAEAGTVVELTNDEWEKLQAVVRSKYDQFAPGAVLELQALARAVSRATEKAPEAKAA